MSLRSFLRETISDFRGMWLVRNQPRQSASRASYAQNVRFKPGGVMSRKGTSLAVSLGTGAIRTLYNWITLFPYVNSEITRLVYFESPDIVAMYDLALNAAIPLYTQSCQAISVAEAETRLYIAHYQTNGIYAGTVKVVNALVGGAPADEAFPDPISDVPTVTESGPGGVDEGLHYFTYRIETRSGFPGAPSSGVTSLNVSAGGKTLNFAMTLDVPPDAAILHVMMTSVDDPDTFYDVPGSAMAVPAGATAWPVSIDIDISDIALAIDSNDATDRFSYLTGANAPLASKVGRYGNRTFYIADKKIYISDPYNAQVLIEDQHAIQVEGQRTLVTAEPLGSTLVIFAFNSTFVVSGDNARVPRQWAPPQRRSDSIGTPAPNGVIAAAGFDGLWVCHQSGLNFFNGGYSTIPLSIMFMDDWARINWAYATTIQMVDNAEERCLYINVPLDDATAPNYRMVIDYSRARGESSVSPFEIDYSLDVYKVDGEVTALHSIGRVQNSTTKVNEVWYGTADGKAIRRDADEITDYGDEPIHAIWETGLLLRQKLKQISRFGGCHVDVKGTGSMTVTPYSMGKQLTPDNPIEAITLQEEPDGEEEVRWHLTSENQSIRFETNSTEASFEINGISAYHKPTGTTKKAA